MVDQKEPNTKRLTHLRPKTFKEDVFRKRETQAENDNLVLKILKIRNKSTYRNGIGEFVTMTNLNGSKMKRSMSARSNRSIRSAGEAGRPGSR